MNSRRPSPIEPRTVPDRPTAKRIAERFSRLLAGHDTATNHRASSPASRDGDDAVDHLESIAALAHDEIELIRGVLDTRFAGRHVPPEQIEELRAAHRRGLAVRQQCAGSALDAELGWLQGYGSFVLMADLSELDRAELERDLDHRAVELRRALALRRMRRPSTER